MRRTPKLLSLTRGQLLEEPGQSAADRLDRVGVVGVVRSAHFLEVGPLAHLASPFDVGVANESFQEVVRLEDASTVLGQDGQRSIKVVEQEVAPLHIAVQHDSQCSPGVQEVAPEPGRDLDLGLLHARDRRFSFHRAGTGQPPQGFFRGELTPLADFPFEFGIRLGTVVSSRSLMGFPPPRQPAPRGSALRPALTRRLSRPQSDGYRPCYWGMSKTWID